MTRDDVSFLIERAAGLWLIVIGLDWLPALVDRWIAGVGVEETAARELALKTFVPLVAGGFLLMRKHPPAVGRTEPAAPSTMTRVDWLWVGLKLVGAWALVNGMSAAASTIPWAFAGAFWSGRSESIVVSLGGILVPIVWITAGVLLLFGDRVWRLACRERS